MKLIVGFLTKSQAMIADGLNSAGDVFASTITYIGNRISSTPGDDEHPYGHGKAEYIFSMVISFFLIFLWHFLYSKCHLIHCLTSTILCIHLGWYILPSFLL